MRDDLRRLLLRQAVIHGPVEMVGDLLDLPEAIRALTVTRFRSRGARSGRTHKSRNRRSVVYWTIEAVKLRGRGTHH